MVTARLLVVGVASDTIGGDKLAANETSIVYADTAAEAIDHVHRGGIDVVVTELELPDGDGIDLIERLQEIRPETPVVVYTNAGSETLASRAIAAGAADYVPESSELDVLDRLERAIDRSKSRATGTRLRNLADAFPDVGFVVDETGQYLEVLSGPDTDELLTDAVDDLLDSRFHDVLPEDIAEELLEAVRNAISRGELQTTRYELPVKKGTEWFDVHVAPIENVSEAVVVARQVTDHVETKRKLQEREAHLEHAQAVANLGSWYKDIENDDIYWSDEVYEIFGVEKTAPSLAHTDFMDFVDPRDRQFVERKWQEALTGAPYDIEHRIRVDGETKWVRERAKIEFSDDREPTRAMGIVQDITERKAYERQLEVKNEQLEVLNRIVRHDIRNQMNVVEGYAATLQETLEGEHARMAAKISSATENLLSISQRIRAINRLVSAPTVDRSTSLRALVEDVLDADFGDRLHTHRTAIPDSLRVRGPDNLRVVLEHAIENAIEHNDTPDPSVEILATERDRGGHVELRIADNGPGLPQTEYELLTGERDRSQLEHSSGLGLWTMRWIVTSLGGTLRFEENEPRGTVVSISLPLANPADHLIDAAVNREPRVDAPPRDTQPRRPG
ncbi:MAG: PAS domain S-box protein [Halobacteriota archaeon]